MNRILSFCTLATAALILAACGSTQGPRVGTYYDYPDKTDSTTFFKREYSETHILKQEIQYVNKKRNGLSKEYYDDGKLKMEITYVDGLKTGPSKLYYESGQLNMEIDYKEEKKDGFTKIYYKNGVLSSVVQFSNGEQLPGIREFRESGEEIEQPEVILTKKGSSLLEVSLSKKRSDLEMFWYPNAETTVGINVPITTEGVGQISTRAGQYVRIRVSYSTSYGNKAILEKEITM